MNLDYRIQRPDLPLGGAHSGAGGWFSSAIRYCPRCLADLELPHVDGPYPRGYHFAKRMSALLLKASMSDQAVREQLNHVRGLLAHPDSLSRPGLLARVLLRSLLPATR